MSLKNDENFHRLLVPAVKDLRELFRAEGFELRMAGGAPRDLLLNILPHDVDFDRVRKHHLLQKKSSYLSISGPQKI